VGCGLDVPYPKKNVRLRQKIGMTGTLVSEYEQRTQPHRWNFPERNRIIAGLCQGVVVVEGGLRSGALITARHALDAGRNVWAIPGSTRNPMAIGPNELIRTGQAALIQGIEHVFEELAPRLVWEGTTQSAGSTPDLGDDDAAVLAALDDVPTPIELIRRACGFAEGRLAMALTRLEVRGFALRRSAGYSLTDTGARVRMAVNTTPP
jgi:DNA processing protein